MPDFGECSPINLDTVTHNETKNRRVRSEKESQCQFNEWATLSFE
jgi:hypothetical protein